MFIGIDPDLHDTAIAFWDKGPVGAKVVHVTKYKGRGGQSAVLDMVYALEPEIWASGQRRPDGIAVEAQTLQRSGVRQHRRPQDIVILGNVAGAILAFCQHLVPQTRLRFPTPEEWKGQIPKQVMQARLYDLLGWGYVAAAGYSVPLRIPGAFDHITRGQWKHVGDALLLSKWASEQVYSP